MTDCVQKRIKIDKEAIKHLRKLKVTEGKSPNIFLSASVSEPISEQSQYVKNKAFNDQYYKDLIVKYLEQYGSAKKRDVKELLWDKLPEVMDDLELLADGKRMPGTELEKVVNERGISSRTMRTAKSRIGDRLVPSYRRRPMMNSHRAFSFTGGF